MASELRQFQFRAGVILATTLALLAGTLFLLGHGSAVSGLIAGGLLGFANLTWMVSTARRFIGRGVAARSIQAVAFVRFIMVAVLLGLILIIAHVNPIAAVAGFGLFPIAAAASGWRFLKGDPLPS